MPVIDRGDDYFQAGTYTGNGSTQTITGLRFQPDFVWIKGRSAASSHRLIDAVRGSNKVLFSNTTDSEFTDNTQITSFNSDGFSLGSQNGVNASGETYVYWAWKANGAGVSNTAGTITSTVSVNTTSGFSIVTYTGTGANATVGHGLGVAPRFILTKCRSNANGWGGYHYALGATNGIFLEETSAAFASSTYWNNTEPTSNVFTLGTNARANESGQTYVAYCFAPVAGYSAFGNFVANGSTDGTFVFTNMRPKFVLLKCSTTAENWVIFDTTRDTYNVVGKLLRPNISDAELDSPPRIDILSNGFKVRASGGSLPNTSNATYIYACFAENPFKYALAR
jgi:hypothetical protein